MLTELNDKSTFVDTGNDPIVIVKYIEGVPGGRSLNTTGFTPEAIKAGHIVIFNSDGVYKPMPVKSDGSAYEALPSGFTPVGVISTSILTEKPLAAIMVRGSVNEIASPYPVTAGIKTALPLICFTKD